jgi:hypothetical protein
MDYEWLEAARRRLSSDVDDDPQLYELDEPRIEQLLDLARIAAHDGGHKTNAPLLCYLVGLAHGRHPDRSLDELIASAASEQSA